MKLIFIILSILSFSAFSQDYGKDCVDALYTRHTNIPAGAIRFCGQIENKYQLGCVAVLLNSFGEIPVSGLRKCKKFNNAYAVKALFSISLYAKSLPVASLAPISKISNDNQLSCVINLLNESEVSNSQVRACSRL